jgi:hypothetical protein
VRLALWDEERLRLVSFGEAALTSTASPVSSCGGLVHAAAAWLLNVVNVRAP